MSELKLASKSQLGQDLWVLQKTGNLTGGFFVEAGACDGLHLSNTYLLEAEFGWDGICCEPNPRYFNKLLQNRQCNKDQRVLYDCDDEVVEFYIAGENGGVPEDFVQESKRLERRLSFPKIESKTVTLNTLLENYNAPSVIDYISLDTEGSELKILKALDFDKWTVRIFSIELNTQVRDDGTDYFDSIRSLMRERGYKCEVNQWDAYFYLE